MAALAARVDELGGARKRRGQAFGMNGFPAELQDFCEAVADDREPLSGGMLARDVVTASYGAYLAAAEGRAVELGEWVR